MGRRVRHDTLGCEKSLVTALIKEHDHAIEFT